MEPNELVSVYFDLPFPMHERNGSGVIKTVDFGATMGAFVVAVAANTGNVVVVVAVVVVDIHTNMVCSKLAAVFCLFSQTQSEKRGRIELPCHLPAVQVSLSLLIVDSF